MIGSRLHRLRRLLSYQKQKERQAGGESGDGREQPAMGGFSFRGEAWKGEKAWNGLRYSYQRVKWA